MSDQCAQTESRELWDPVALHAVCGGHQVDSGGSCLPFLQQSLAARRASHQPCRYTNHSRQKMLSLMIEVAANSVLVQPMFMRHVLVGQEAAQMRDCTFDRGSIWEMYVAQMQHMTLCPCCCFPISSTFCSASLGGSRTSLGGGCASLASHTVGLGPSL